MTTDRGFGRLPDGREVHVLSIGSAPGPALEVLTLGAAVHRLEVTGGDGVRRNVALALPDVAERQDSTDYLGGTIGRYANRIAHGRFPLAGREVEVRTHDRGHSLHGGPDGFDTRLWDVVTHGPDELVLAVTSPDGDQGFPGEVHARVTYRVTGDTVSIALEATTDATTVLNMTNHTYVNLDGADLGGEGGDGLTSVRDHTLLVEAAEYTPIDPTGIPLGGHAPVDGTPFDFREPAPVGPALDADHPQLEAGHGVDHDFVVRGHGLRRAAAVSSPTTRTVMEVWSDQPGLQVYTGNVLGGTRSGTPGRHRPFTGIALEPQLHPDSPNRPEWPSPVLEPGDTYRSAIEWRFPAAR